MPATFFASSRVWASNGSRLWNWYLLVLMMTRSASISRTIASEDSKKPRSKPSCTSINSTANPIPALDRTRRRLLARRLRSASGTNRVPAKRALDCTAVTARLPSPRHSRESWNPGSQASPLALDRRFRGGHNNSPEPVSFRARSEDFSGVGAPQAAQREKRRGRRHHQGDREHRAELRDAQGKRQQGLGADQRIDRERRAERRHERDRHDQPGFEQDDPTEIAVAVTDCLQGGELRQLAGDLGCQRLVQHHDPDNERHHQT